MNKFYTIILAALLALPTFAQQITEENCMEDFQLKYNYPSYFCDCELQIKKNRFSIPFDAVITDTTWYKGSSGLLLNGCSAYLYSECDVKMVIMQNCSNDSNAKIYKEVLVQSNQARDVEASSIKEHMEANGVTGNISMRIGIFPAEPGKESRFIVVPYNEGPHSTCEDCLPLLKDMVFVSSNADDVYALEPTTIPATNGLKIEWFKTEYPVQLQITQGACDGAVVESAFLMPDDVYEVPTALLNQVRGGEENLYIHFLHAPATAGRIRLSEVNKTTTGCDNITTPATDARLVLGNNGMIYIVRDGARYTLTGARF